LNNNVVEVHQNLLKIRLLLSYGHCCIRLLMAVYKVNKNMKQIFLQS